MMNESPGTSSRILMEHSIRPSKPRVAILDYLLAHRTHPTVEEVYSALRPCIPTLSLTTCYNTLRMFADCGVAKMITIDERRICYDADTSLHGHFYCRACEKVYDIFPSEALQQMCYKEVDGRFRSVDECDLYYKGICEACAAKAEAADHEKK